MFVDRYKCEAFSLNENWLLLVLGFDCIFPTLEQGLTPTFIDLPSSESKLSSEDEQADELL